MEGAQRRRGRVTGPAAADINTGSDVFTCRQMAYDWLATAQRDYHDGQFDAAHAASRISVAWAAMHDVELSQAELGTGNPGFHFTRARPAFEREAARHDDSGATDR